MNLRREDSSTTLMRLQEEDPELKTLFQLYPEEASSKLLENRDKLKKIAVQFQNTKDVVTLNSIIMTCAEKCVFQEVCILAKNNLAPVGYECPIEKKVIIELETDIVDELQIDRGNPIEMELLWDLIEAKLLDMRASGALKNGQVTFTSLKKFGNQSFEVKEIAPEILIKIELKKLKNGIIEEFIATRKSKKKYGTNSDLNTIEQLLLRAAGRIDAECQIS